MRDDSYCCHNYRLILISYGHITIQMSEVLQNTICMLRHAHEALCSTLPEEERRPLTTKNIMNMLLALEVKFDEEILNDIISLENHISPEETDTELSNQQEPYFDKKMHYHTRNDLIKELQSEISYESFRENVLRSIDVQIDDFPISIHMVLRALSTLEKIEGNSMNHETKRVVQQAKDIISHSLENV